MATSLCIHQPIKLEGEWNKVWFDTSHQHCLLFDKDMSYWVWSTNSDCPSPYLQDSSSANSSTSFAKISLDFQVLAAQTSPTQVIVTERATKKRWTVEIQSPDKNFILPDGLLWSEHGGNSQDLVIITFRGMELYKVSSSRGQCKLSRTVNQPTTFHFWYEPNHRMILLASSKEEGRIGTDSFKVSGYFFRSEISDMPRFELPPPKKIPDFDLEAGVKLDDVSLISVYGALYCTVHTVKANSSTGMLSLYAILKTSVVKAYNLMLPYADKLVRLSVTDNLICCHMYNSKSSVVFDIRCTKGKRETTFETVTVFPIEPAGPVIFADGSAFRPSLTGAVDDYMSNSEGDATNVMYQSFTEMNTSILNTLNRKSHEDASAMGASDKTTHSPRGSSHSPRGSMRDPQAYSGSLRRGSQNFEGAGRGAIGGVTNLYEEGQWELFAPCWIWRISVRCMYRLGYDLRAASKTIVDHRTNLTFMGQRGQPFWAPHAVYRSLGADDLSLLAKEMMIAVLERALREKMNLSWIETLFNAVNAPYANALAMLHLVSTGVVSLTELDQTIPAGVLEFIHATESDTSGGTPISSRRGSLEVNNEEMSSAGGLVRRQRAVSTPDGLPPASPVAPSSSDTGRRKSFVMSMKKPDGGTYVAGSGSGAIQGQPIRASDFEPLEPEHAMYSFLPEITAVCGRSRFRTTTLNDMAMASRAEVARNEPVNIEVESAVEKVKKNSGRGNGTPTQPTQRDNEYGTVRHPLSVRRDTTGTLVVTQIELLSHLWLPLALSNAVDPEYLRWALSGYISCLRGFKCPIPISIHPALCVLLLNLLMSIEAYVEMANLLQMQFFPDSEEVAFSALEVSDVILEREKSKTAVGFTSCEMRCSDFDCVGSGSSMIRVEFAVRVLQQVGLDILWRIRERATVVRWLLGRGRVLEAISLCSKRRGRWREGLTPHDVSGTDFFIAALTAIRSINRGMDDVADDDGDDTDNESAPDTPADDVTIDDPAGPQRGSETEDEADFDEDAYEEAIAHIRARRVQIMTCVHKFIWEWDRDAFKTSNEENRSKLSLQAQFPEHLFSEPQAKVLKMLYGYM